MKSFLEIVAEDLSKKYDGDFSKTAIVFPNKRASLFFNEHLAKAYNRSIWSPTIMSISELFGQISNIKKGDDIEVVFDLYQIIKQEQDKISTNMDNIDEFYMWGEVLMKDFDDVDKNLVDAYQLFTNLENLKEFEDNFSYLTDEQKAAIEMFFNNFHSSESERTELKQRFYDFWSRLFEIYENYKEKLTNKGYGYEGMIYRDAVSRFEGKKLRFDRYIFIGFNALNKVEKKLLRLIKEEGKAMFYWDYDLHYLKNIADHEAGSNIRENIIVFGNELSDEYFDNISKEKNITYIASDTENAQAKFIPQWVKDTLISNYEQEKDNAIVLCNENILLPVIHSLPKEFNNINITMGFPLNQTPIYSLIRQLMKMYSDGYKEKEDKYLLRFVKPVLSHPYVKERAEIDLDEELKQQKMSRRILISEQDFTKDKFIEKLFEIKKTPKELCNHISEIIKEVSMIYRSKDGKRTNDKDNEGITQLYKESIFNAYTLINRLYNIIDSNNTEIGINTLHKLIDKILKGAKIPFHGEPAIGLQIMGVLETRNLDFKNILILSANEGFIPKKAREVSFIPYNLRRGFDMTLVEKNDAVYSYYFYKMIQRAENIVIMYNTSTDGIVKGEQSRFMLQLLVETNQSIEQRYISSNQDIIEDEKIEVHSNDDIVSILVDKYITSEKENEKDNKKKKALSPSALNTYIDCGLQFYFKYVANIKVEEDLDENIDVAMFGSIFHKSAQLMYEYLTEKECIVYKEDIDSLLKEKHKIENFVDTAFREEFFNVDEKKSIKYTGVQRINRDVIIVYLTKLLEYDREKTPFEIVSMEKEYHDKIDLEIEERYMSVEIGGIVDRIDRTKNGIEIIDYKTGNKEVNISKIDELFISKEDRKKHLLQIFLYSHILSERQANPVLPIIISLTKIGSKDYSPNVRIKNEIVLDYKNHIVTDKQTKETFDLKETYYEKLKSTVAEIFSKETVFRQTDAEKVCSYCNYKHLCRR